MSFKDYKILASCCWALWAMGGCVQVKDLPAPVYKKKLVLNGTLYPDSLVSVQLSTSLPASESDKPQFVTNALVECFENGRKIDTLNYTSRGKYVGKLKPKATFEYLIRVVAPGFAPVEAKDIVPKAAVALVSLTSKDPQNPNQNENVKLTISNGSVPDDRVVWFAAYIRKRELDLQDPAHPLRLLTKSPIILSSSELLDKFNSFFDSVHGQRSYGEYARIDPVLVAQNTNPEILFTVNNQIVVKNSEEAFFVYVFSVSKTYDQYLKSAIVAYQNRVSNPDGTLNNPFAEYSPVFSNVSGGTGVLGGINGKIYRLK